MEDWARAGAAAKTLVRRLAAIAPATALAATALAVSGAVLVVLTGPLTFILDDWAFLVLPPGFDAAAILEPHDEHIVVGPVLVYKALMLARWPPGAASCCARAG